MYKRQSLSAAKDYTDKWPFWVEGIEHKVDSHGRHTVELILLDAWRGPRNGIEAAPRRRIGRVYVGAPVGRRLIGRVNIPPPVATRQLIGRVTLPVRTRLFRIGLAPTRQLIGRVSVTSTVQRKHVGRVMIAQTTTPEPEPPTPPPRRLIGRVNICLLYTSPSPRD